ncbi:MAG TPA: NAD(P)H-dependent oxidoreductase [Candidatus Saccharimonadales bacterium]|nr:NAD(P)H-dependent oxidoreductase [Candidatus Saccharimonadales bacterium]
MSNNITIALIAGTSRAGRESIKAARYVAEFGQNLPDVTIVFVDPTDFHLAGDGNDPEAKDPAYTAITQKADAFFIVTPEYNHSFPGSLKRLLDSEYANYIHKPVALAGVSNGAWGGVRAVEALVTSVREMGLVATSYSVYFPRVQDLFTADGQLKAAHVGQYSRSVGYAYNELLWLARALKSARKEK